MANKYNFDPTGTSAANRITNEQQVITAVNFRDYHYIIPKFAPFFQRNLLIKIQFPDRSQRTLIEGVDYYLSNQFIDASRACANPIYGSISFLDTSLYGIISITYNTVGGIWNLSLDEITRILAEEMRNPRTTTWEQITYLPERFPVVDHEWDLIDMVGEKELVKAIDDITGAIFTASGGGLQAHLHDLNNPHAVTKAQVGLSSVQNYGIATQQQAEIGQANNVYMTPLRTANAIAALGGALVNLHEGRHDNPHQVTKTQVGLGNVQNFGVATDAEARQGIAPNLYMTPLNTKAVIDVVNAAINAHISDHLNPHDTSKYQVGLFNVENYLVATEQEARAGVANDRYMTPQRTMQLCREFVTYQLDGHATRMDNPHNVTKDQIGLSLVQNFGVATPTEMTVGTANDKYVTPALVAYRMQQIYINGTEPHLLDFNNPHNVTAAQVGAFTTIEVNNLLASYLKKTDKATDSDQLEGRTTMELRDWLMSNMPGFNAETVGGMNVQQITNLIAGNVGSSFLKNHSAPFASSNPNQATWIAFGDISYVRDPSGNIADNDYCGVLTTGDSARDPAGTQIDPIAIRTVLHNGPGAAPSVEAHRIFPSSKPNGISIGWTVDEANARMRLYAKVYGTTNMVTVSDTFGRIFDTSVTQVEYPTEPAGIVYTSITSGVSDDLLRRVASLEALLAGVTVV